MERAFRGRAAVQPQVFRIRRAERAIGGKAALPARVFHVLRVEGVGEAELARIAAAQSGVLDHRQLSDGGLSRDAIGRRVRAGGLHPMFPGVFGLGYPRIDEAARLMAGLLYLGDGTVVSHASAAALWEFAPLPSVINLTRQGGGFRSRPGLWVRRVSVFDIRDVRLHRGLPVTAPARALLDLAADADDDEVERALAQARMRQLVSDAELEAALGRAPTRRGARRLRRVMRDVGGAVMTRSKAERLMRRLISTSGLPMPETNARVLGHEVDFLWRSHRVIVEFDGFEFHRHRHQFESDRRRDQVLAAAGYRVIRVTWRQLQEEPMALAVRIGQALVAF